MGYAAHFPSGASPLGRHPAPGYGYGRRRRLGQFDLSSLLGGAGMSADTSSAVDTIGSVAGAGANALLPGSGAVVTPIIDTIGALFGGGAPSAKDVQRQQHIYSYYYNAMTLPGSAPSVQAVQTLYDIANQLNGQNNPEATRLDAQTALTRLSQQGWIGTNTETPHYVGALAVGSASGALVPASRLPRAYGSGPSLGTLALYGLGAYVLYRVVA